MQAIRRCGSKLSQETSSQQAAEEINSITMNYVSLKRLHEVTSDNDKRIGRIQSSEINHSYVSPIIDCLEYIFIGDFRISVHFGLFKNRNIKSFKTNRCTYLRKGHTVVVYNIMWIRSLEYDCC